MTPIIKEPVMKKTIPYLGALMHCRFKRRSQRTLIQSQILRDSVARHLELKEERRL